MRIIVYLKIVSILDVRVAWFWDSHWGAVLQGPICPNSWAYNQTYFNCCKYFLHSCKTWLTRVPLLETPGTPEDLYQFVAHQPEAKGYYCTICSKARPKRTEVRNHVESIHFPNSFCYQCQTCEKTFRSKNALKVHNTTNHGNIYKKEATQQ